MRILFAFLIGFSFATTAHGLGDDIVKLWRGKQEAYYKGEALVHANTIEAINRLKGLLRKYKWDNNKKVELTHKLAELELAAGRVIEKERGGSKLSTHTRRALDLFEGLVKEHPRYRKMENVLFSYGFELFMRRRFKRSYEILTLLNNRFPKSEFGLDSVVLRADAKYELKQFSKAVNLYGQTIYQKNYPLAGYSQYRRSWAYYKQGKYNSAYRNLVGVILKKDQGASELIDPKKEALTDISMFYHRQTAQFRPFKDLSSLVPRSNLEATVSALAQLYFEGGQWTKAIKTYDDLIKKFKKSNQISIYHLNKGISLSTRKRVLAAGTEISLGLSKCKTKECRRVANDTIFKLMNAWEKHWRKNQKNRDYLSALRTVYPKLVDAAESTVEKSKIYLLLAEIEEFSKSYESASVAYENAHKTNPKASYANESFWNAIDMLRKLKSRKWQKNRIKRLERLTQSYISAFPSTSRSIDAQDFLADVYVKSGRLDLARKLYANLSHKYLSSKAGLSAYNSYLKLQIKSKNYRDITLYLLDYRKKDTKKIRARITSKDLDEAYEEWSQNLVKQKKYLQSVKVLKEAIKNRSGSRFASDWKWNLSFSLLSAKKHRASADSFVEYVDKYRNKDKKEIDGLRNALNSYRKQKLYTRAIPVVDRLIRADRKNRNPLLIEKTHLFLKKKKPIKAFGALSRVSRDHVGKNETFLLVMDKFNEKQARQVLNSNLRGFSNEAVAELVQKLILEINNIDKKATKVAARSLIRIRTKDKSYAAKGNYIIGMHEMRKFSKRKHSINSNLKRSLDKIVKEILVIDSYFRKAVELSSGDTQVSSLIAMGNLYSIVGKKFKPLAQGYIKKKVSIVPLKNTVDPFFAQTKIYWSEARKSMRSVRNTRKKKELQKLLGRYQKSMTALESWYVKGSKLSLLSRKGGKGVY